MAKYLAAAPIAVPKIDAVNPDAANTVPNTPTPDFFSDTPPDTMGLCLSGGGYRAMLYHVGALIRMNEMGLLPKLAEISCVSGGSIAGGQLALAWPKLRFDDKGVASNLIEEFATPLIRFAHVRADVPSVLKGLVTGMFSKNGGPAMELAAVYDKHLFHGARLADLPDAPQFKFQATNLQTTEGFQFAKDAATDDRVGVIKRPAFRLARAVAASSAYPPFLSPVYLDMSDQVMEPRPGDDLHVEPYTKMAVLTDGGVDDNLGLMDVLTHCRTVLISNAGAIVPQMGKPTGRWVGQFARVLTAAQYQVELRDQIMLKGLTTIGQRKVAWWKIARPLGDYGAANPMALSDAEIDQAAHIPTRLTKFSDDVIALAMKAGYAGADASLRVHGFGAGAPTGDFAHLPRPDTGTRMEGPA